MNTHFACVILVIFASVILAANADFRQIMRDCMAENKVTEAEIQELMANGMNTEPSDNTKCYPKCVMEKLGHYNNGVFNPQAALETLKETHLFKDNIDAIPSAVQACKDVKGSNECDTAFKILMCLKEHK